MVKRKNNDATCAFLYDEDEEVKELNTFYESNSDSNLESDSSDQPP